MKMWPSCNHAQNITFLLKAVLRTWLTHLTILRFYIKRLYKAIYIFSRHATKWTENEFQIMKNWAKFNKKRSAEKDGEKMYVIMLFMIFLFVKVTQFCYYHYSVFFVCSKKKINWSSFLENFFCVDFSFPETFQTRFSFRANDNRNS